MRSRRATTSAANVDRRLNQIGAEGLGARARLHTHSRVSSQQDRFVTGDGIEFELGAEHELEETIVTSRMREVLEEFADAQSVAPRRREWINLDEGFTLYRPTKGLPEGRLPSLRTPGPKFRFSSVWWKQRYAQLKADPARYAKEKAQKQEWGRKKYQSNAQYRARRQEEARQRMRAWYARVKADPARHKKLLADIRRRAQKRYQTVKSDPAQRERYERLLREAAGRSRANYRRKRASAAENQGARP